MLDPQRTKPVYLTQKEAELVLDSFKVSNPITRDLALKVAGMVLEFAAEEDLNERLDAAGLPAPEPRLR